MTKFQDYKWVWVLAGTLLFFALYMVKDILPPFISGIIVAYTLNPLVSKFERLGISRLYGAAFTILSFLLLLVFIISTALPYIQAELFRLARNLPHYGQELMLTLRPLLDTAATYLSDQEINKLNEALAQYTKDVVRWGMGALINLLTSGFVIANMLSLIIITPIVAFYFLKDWRLILGHLDTWLPRASADTIRHLIRQIDRIFSSFARGQATVCLILACIYSLGLTLLRLDFSLTIGVMTGILSFIPYVGVMIGCTAAVSIAIAQFGDWGHVGMVALVFLTGLGIEGYFLTPRLLGERIGLHPLWIIFAVLAGGSLKGFLGIIIALPSAAVIGVLVRYGLSQYLKSNFYEGSKLKPQNSPLLPSPKDAPKDTRGSP